MGGWKVNPILTWTGIPTVNKMSMEEYQASRNLPISPYIAQKENPVVTVSIRKETPFRNKQL